MKMLILILLQISLALPNSTPEQLYTTSEDYYQTTGYRASGPNRAPQGDDDPWGDAYDEDNPESFTYPDGPDLPIGNGVWVLLLLAATYGIIRSRGVGRRGVVEERRKAEKKRGK